jgi:hypothetical protein
VKGLNVFGYICPINYWNGGDLKRMFQRFVNNIEIAARKFREHEEEG